MRGSQKSHAGKIVGPVVIVVLLVLYYVGYAMLAAALVPWFWLRVVLAMLPLGVAALSIYVLVQRIREIRSGEEDDLSQY